MSRIVQIKIFNDILDQFFVYLGDEFPYFHADIILTKNAVVFMRRSNPRLVVEQFLQYLIPYSKQIFDCDEDFFFNFESNMSDLGSDNLLYGLKLKNFFLENQNTDKGMRQKATVFYFFQRLLTAGEKTLH
jgi:hypothetical protein